MTSQKSSQKLSWWRRVLIRILHQEIQTPIIHNIPLLEPPDIYKVELIVWPN